MVAPRYTPWIQLKLWKISGIVLARRPPKMIALIGTPAGWCASGASAGLFVIGEVKRELGCAAFSFEAGDHGLPFQSSSPSGGGSSCPSHHTVPSGESATLV